MAIPERIAWKEWTDDEVAEAKRLREAGQSYRDIGKALGRTHSAVERRLYIEKIKGPANGAGTPPQAVEMPPPPAPEPAPLPLDLEQLFQLGGTLMGLFEPLAPPVRTLLLDWLNKKYR